VRLFSPQRYFIKEQDGKLKMNKEGITLSTIAHKVTKLSFPINEQNNPPLALPKWTDTPFFTFCVVEDAIHLGATAEKNQNQSALRNGLLKWDTLVFKWVQSLMTPHSPCYQKDKNNEGLHYKVVKPSTNPQVHAKCHCALHLNSLMDEEGQMAS
jgi:hypothetical protein